MSTKKILVSVVMACAMIYTTSAYAQVLYDFNTDGVGAWDGCGLGCQAEVSGGTMNLSYYDAATWMTLVQSGMPDVDVTAAGLPYIVSTFTATGFPEGDHLSLVWLFEYEGESYLPWWTPVYIHNGVNTMVIDASTAAWTASGGTGQPTDPDTNLVIIRFSMPWQDGVPYSSIAGATIAIDGVAITSSTTDYDLDGLTNEEEATHGTDAFDVDTDGDGLSDAVEVNTTLTNPLVADTDSDGLTDNAEVNIYLSNPVMADTDSDGIPDGVEVNTHGTNPNLVDTDGDGASDSHELFVSFTDPLVPGSFPLPVAGVTTLLVLAAGLGGVSVRRLLKR